MGATRVCRRHPWGGIHYASRTVSPDGQFEFWTRVTLGFWTIEFLPPSAATRIEKVLDFLWGNDEPPPAGTP